MAEDRRLRNLPIYVPREKKVHSYITCRTCLSPFDFFRSVDFLNSFNLQARGTLFQSNVGWKDCQCFQSLPTSTLVDISQIWKVRIDPTNSWRNSSSNCPSRQIGDISNNISIQTHDCQGTFQTLENFNFQGKARKVV